MKDLDVIRLYRTEQGWMACWQGPHAYEVAQLFGTNTLPTGFTAGAEASIVLAEIARLNPDVVVLLAAEELTAT